MEVKWNYLSDLRKLFCYNNFKELEFRDIRKESMNLVQKGKRNLELAKILDSDEFHNLSGFQKEHLCSIIINRLYYGVYLLGKDKLLAKDNSIDEGDFLGHGTRNDIKYIRNNDEAKASKFLWVRLKGFYGGHNGITNMCLTAAKLQEMRNCYDYQSDMEACKALKDLESCKKLASFLQEKLRRLE